MAGQDLDASERPLVEMQRKRVDGDCVADEVEELAFAAD